MKPAAFDYIVPRTKQEVLDLLAHLDQHLTQVSIPGPQTELRRVHDHHVSPAGGHVVGQLRHYGVHRGVNGVAQV